MNVHAVAGVTPTQSRVAALRAQSATLTPSACSERRACARAGLSGERIGLAVLSRATMQGQTSSCHEAPTTRRRSFGTAVLAPVTYRSFVCDPAAGPLYGNDEEDRGEGDRSAARGRAQPLRSRCDGNRLASACHLARASAGAALSRCAASAA